MSRYRRAKIEGGTYFFTVVTHRRQKILCDEPVRSVLRSAILTTKTVSPFAIEGWVLLPDHLHCIWILPPDDADFGKRWAMIKRYVTRRCGPALCRRELLTESRRRRKESTIWQRRFWEHSIRDEEDYVRCMDYLHFNPVKHGLVTRAQDWPFSTIHRFRENGDYPKLKEASEAIHGEEYMGE